MVLARLEGEIQSLQSLKESSSMLGDANTRAADHSPNMKGDDALWRIAERHLRLWVGFDNKLEQFLNQVGIECSTHCYWPPLALQCASKYWICHKSCEEC